jgi:hypothetical protein
MGGKASKTATASKKAAIGRDVPVFMDAANDGDFD